MPVNEKSIKNLKPPKKGEVRNPMGKSVGTLSSKTVIKRWLATTENYENPISGVSEMLTQLDIGILQQVKKIREGDLAALKELLDRMEGKATNNVDVKSDGEKLTTTIFQLDARFKEKDS